MFRKPQLCQKSPHPARPRSPPPAPAPTPAAARHAGHTGHRSASHAPTPAAPHAGPLPPSTPLPPSAHQQWPPSAHQQRPPRVPPACPPAARPPCLARWPPCLARWPPCLARWPPCLARWPAHRARRAPTSSGHPEPGSAQQLNTTSAASSIRPPAASADSPPGRRPPRIVVATMRQQPDGAAHVRAAGRWSGPPRCGRRLYTRQTRWHQLTGWLHHSSPDMRDLGDSSPLRAVRSPPDLGGIVRLLQAISRCGHDRGWTAGPGDWAAVAAEAGGRGGGWGG